MILMLTLNMKLPHSRIPFSFIVKVEDGKRSQFCVMHCLQDSVSAPSMEVCDFKNFSTMNTLGPRYEGSYPGQP